MPPGGGDEEEDRELRRYKNRAALLERTLRDKMSELKRARNRAAVLRDVASRLKAANTNITARTEEETKVAAEAAAVSAREEAEARLGRDVESTREELGVEREGRVQASVRYDALVDRMEERDMEYMSERDRSAREAEENERGLKSELRAIRRGRDEAERAGAEARDALEDSREEVRGLEERLERSEAERETLSSLLNEREEEIKILAQEERSKRQRLKEELALARAAQQQAEEVAEAAASAATTTTATPETEDADKVRDEESAAIAAASVRAAEGRETDALSRLDAAGAELRSALSEREAADALLREAAEERDAALVRLEALRDARDGREGRLVDRLGRAEEEATRLESEVDLLARERDDARDGLMDERMAHWAKVREEQARFDRAVAEERGGHERQVVDLRERLRRAEAVALKGGVPAVDSRRVDQTLSWETLGGKGQEGSESPATETSRLRRVWRRIRSPRSWFSRST